MAVENLGSNHSSPGILELKTWGLVQSVLWGLVFLVSVFGWEVVALLLSTCDRLIFWALLLPT